MNASDAQALVYSKNKMKKGIKEINKLISAAAENGEFHISVLTCWDWGSVYDLKKYYKSKKFKVSTTHRQTSPNDGDDYIHISWEEK